MINYNTGTPTEIGVYACRVPHEASPETLRKDVFLIWINGRWGYPSSDQKYRGKVLGWVGPLDRKGPPVPDVVLKDVAEALKAYAAEHTGSVVRAYRIGDQIRVRVVDAGFANLGSAARYDRVWGYLERLGADAREQVTYLLTMTPHELEAGSSANTAFEEGLERG